MNGTLLPIIIFGLLLAEEKIKELDLRIDPQSLWPFIFQCFHLVWQVPVLIAIYHFVIETKIPLTYTKDWALLFLFPAAFALGRLENKSSRFFLVTFAIAFLVLSTKKIVTIDAKLLMGIYLCSGVIVFQFLFLGLWEKLRLSRIPSPINGLALIFGVTVMTVMAMGRLLGILS